MLPLYKLGKSGVHWMMKRIPKIIGACAALVGLVYLLVAGNALRHSSISASGSMVVVTQGTSVTFVPKAGADAVFIVKGSAPATNASVQATNTAAK